MGILKAIGTGVGAYFGGPSGAAIGGSIGGSLDDSRDKPKRDKSYFQRSVKDAKAAGLHPLFALGASGGSGQSFSIPGQSQSGDWSKEAITQLSNMRKPPDSTTGVIQAQTALAAVELARHSISNDKAQTITVPAYQPLGQDIQKGRTDAHMTQNPEQSLNVKSPMTIFRLGSQRVWMPAEDMETVIEDPLKIAALTYMYHGNKDVDWSKLAFEYSGTRAGHALSKRNPAAFRSGQAFRNFMRRNAKRLKDRKFTGNPYLGLQHQRTN